MIHLHLLFYYFHIYRPLLCGHLSGNEHWTVFIVVDNQMFIVLARQLTIYSRRRLIKTSSQNQEVITIKK